jgi:hypothetical protein
VSRALTHLLEQNLLLCASQVQTGFWAMLQLQPCPAQLLMSQIVTSQMTLRHTQQQRLKLLGLSRKRGLPQSQSELPPCRGLKTCDTPWGRYADRAVCSA